ncbi:hypothetical protein BBO99_00007971 [Phytophthora kernoviae]|uniref:M96 mating-specific protein family n=2 Tax=Phytophthora kernoviae TaxID=325452 RepID=A0A3R7G6U9_9STRA|nr:hypothetical protein G195_010875 [Phytophthora kernoviae 00238/432]KAG2506860.1 hypothetical protein JM16_008889 [Phytophthora kernoviae]KAG2508669.1 hypothetical protein JM18_009146 [Phytophthora kernoviae]RLN43721.1 hypothetical protein BBI17_007921 [Phytophthora kernoviae]RLN75902.1 hypothetical protein BBO99_00007971 [Phytophthora kernoviae]
MSFKPTAAAAAEEDEDAQTLEAAMSFLAECQASTEWLLGADESLDLVDVDHEDLHEFLNDNLELPSLTEQLIPEEVDTVSAFDDVSPVSVELALSLRDSASRPSSETGSPTSEQLNLQGKKAKQPRKYSNRARDARREELVYLRQKVKDLQLQLDQLRDTHKPQTASAPFSSVAAPLSAADLKNAKIRKRPSLRTATVATSTPSATFSSVAAPMASTASPSHLAAVWGDMAQRQALERQKAERENVRLKLVLEKQIKMAKSLERILKKRHNERGILQALGGPSKRIRRVAPVPGPNTTRDDRADFDILLSGIDKSRQEPLHIEANDNIVVERYGMEMTDGHTQGDFHVKNIIRRYVEHDRIIVVWRTITETVEFSSEPTPGIRFLEKGYIVIKPPATGQKDCTLMQTCYIIRPEIYGRNGPEQSRKVGALTDFVLSSVSGSISASHQMIENVLLSGSLKK